MVAICQFLMLEAYFNPPSHLRINEEQNILRYTVYS